MDTFTMRIPKGLKLKFKLKTVAQGADMAKIIRNFIEEYINETKKNNKTNN